MSKNLCRLAAILGAPFVLTACSTINPYVNVDDSVATNAKTSFANAEAYADALKDEYRSALGNNAKLQTIGGLGLLGISSATAGLGAAGVSGTEILVLGLTGSTIYSGGQFLSNQPRLFAYAAGKNAVTCAVAVMRPLDLANNAQFKSVQALYATSGVADSEIDKRISATELALAELRVELAQLPGDAAFSGLRTLVTREIEAAETALQTAMQARSRGEAMLNEVQGAPGKLVDALNDIRDDVDSVSVRTAQSLSRIPSLIGGLGETYSVFTAVPDAMRLSSGDSESQISSQSARAGNSALTQSASKALIAIRKLVAARASLESASRQVRDFAAALQAARPDSALSQCQIDGAAIAPNLSVSTSEIEVKHGTAEEVVVSISGGVPEYRIASAPSNDKVSASIPFGARTLRIIIADDTPVGRHAVIIADNIGANTTVSVNVVPKGENAGGSGAVPGTPRAAASDPLKTAFDALQSEEDRKSLQRSVCLQSYEQDGRYGEKTRAQLVRTISGIESVPDIAAVFAENISTPDKNNEACQKFEQEDLRKIVDAHFVGQTFDWITSEGPNGKVTLAVSSLTSTETTNDDGDAVINGLELTAAIADPDSLPLDADIDAPTEDETKLAFLSSYSNSENTGTIDLAKITIRDFDEFLTALGFEPGATDDQ